MEDSPVLFRSKREKWGKRLSQRQIFIERVGESEIVAWKVRVKESGGMTERENDRVVKWNREMVENMKQEDLEIDNAADTTRGCVDPAVHFWASVGQGGTLLSVLTLIKSCRYCEWVTKGLEKLSSQGMSCIYVPIVSLLSHLGLHHTSLLQWS